MAQHGPQPPEHQGGEECHYSLHCSLWSVHGPTPPANIVSDEYKQKIDSLYYPRSAESKLWTARSMGRTAFWPVDLMWPEKTLRISLLNQFLRTNFTWRGRRHSCPCPPLPPGIHRRRRRSGQGGGRRGYCTFLWDSGFITLSSITFWCWRNKIYLK